MRKLYQSIVVLILVSIFVIPTKTTEAYLTSNCDLCHAGYTCVPILSGVHAGDVECVETNIESYLTSTCDVCHAGYTCVPITSGVHAGDVQCVETTDDCGGLCPEGYTCVPRISAGGAATGAVGAVSFECVETTDDCDCPEGYTCVPRIAAGGATIAVGGAMSFECVEGDGRRGGIFGGLLEWIEEAKKTLGGEYIFGIKDLLIGFYKIILPIAVTLGILLVIRAGYTFMTSQGDPRKVQDSKENLTSAIMGLLFVLLSTAILNVIINKIILG